MKYVRKKKGGGWVYDPPTKYQTLGLVERKHFEDGRGATLYGGRANKRIRDYNSGKLAHSKLPTNPTINHLINHYKSTSRFKSFKVNTQRSYESGFKVISDTCGNVKVSNISSLKCSDYYESWLERGVSGAQHITRIFSVLMSHAQTLDLIGRNPMAVVKKVTAKPSRETWTQDQVFQFVETAFSKWEWKSIGILVLLCYEWGQRPVDIINLRWDSVDLDTRTVNIEQQKRGATVHLPISDPVMKVLLQQREDLPKSEWVCPSYRSYDRTYKPMSPMVVSRMKVEVCEAAGLPTTMQIGHLRRTAITEMVDGGADSTAIMSVSGHKNITSLNPYLKHTRAGAVEALSHRSKS